MAWEAKSNAIVALPWRVDDGIQGEAIEHGFHFYGQNADGVLLLVDALNGNVATSHFLRRESNIGLKAWMKNQKRESEHARHDSRALTKTLKERGGSACINARTDSARRHPICARTDVPAATKRNYATLCTRYSGVAHGVPGVPIGYWLFAPMCAYLGPSLLSERHGART